VDKVFFGAKNLNIILPINPSGDILSVLNVTFIAIPCALFNLFTSDIITAKQKMTSIVSLVTSAIHGMSMTTRKKQNKPKKTRSISNKTVRSLLVCEQKNPRSRKNAVTAVTLPADISDTTTLSVNQSVIKKLIPLITQNAIPATIKFGTWKLKGAFFSAPLLALLIK